MFMRTLQNAGILPEDPILYFRDCMLKGIDTLQIPFKKEVWIYWIWESICFEEICQKFVPSSILNNYVKSIYTDFSSFWNFRRKFTSQYASTIFTTYILAIGHRFPHKIGFTRDSCSLVSSEMLPALNQSGQFTLTEAVPFRLTSEHSNLPHWFRYWRASYYIYSRTRPGSFRKRNKILLIIWLYSFVMKFSHGQTRVKVLLSFLLCLRMTSSVCNQKLHLKYSRTLK